MVFGLVAAEGNLSQFFMLGDGWFFVHIFLLDLAVPGGNVPPFDQIYHLFLGALQTFPGLLSCVGASVSCRQQLAFCQNL